MVMSPYESLVFIREREKEKNQGPGRINHTAPASCFSPALLTASRDFWYCLRYLLLMNVENRVIVIMLSTTHEIWIPKFMPTEDGKGKQLSVPQDSTRDLRSQIDLLSCLVLKQIVNTVLDRL